MTTIPLSVLEEITNGFSVDTRIGRGRYGDVYKGVYNGREVAVKLLHVDTVRGLDDQQFKNEVGNLLRVKHPNIVQLVGYCYETRKIYVEGNVVNNFSEHIYRVLCFEHLQAGSLDKHLYGQSFAPNWSTRYNIIKGVCEGLNFLHKCEPQILHLDLKPANILLDSSMEPKVADLGLSRIFAQSHMHVTERIIGTRKYMPPEFIKEGKISPKNDVFSFGVVMIEIMTSSLGYSNSLEVDDIAQFKQEAFTNWCTVIEATSKYRSEELYQVQTCIDLAIRCVDSERDNRPTTADILDALNKTEANIPKKQLADAFPLEKSDPNHTTAKRLKKMTAQLEKTPTIQLQMDHRAITAQSELEHMLHDETAEPMALPLSLLEHITSRFSDDKQIGQGGFATVYKGVLRNGMIAVKKIIATVDIDEKKFTDEICCLMKAKHKNIVRFLGYCSDTQGEMLKFDGKLVLADLRERLLCFEYLPKGSLEKHITDASCGLQWKLRYQIINGVCDGLYHLHEIRILHSDLKPENILLDDNMIPKIADFGISRCLDEKQTHYTASKLIGTLGYIAPELFRGGSITLKSDIYSLGIIIIEIITGGKSDPNIENVLESWRNRLEKSLKSEVDTQLVQVQVCTAIAMECTESNPAKRPDIYDIIDRLGATKSAGDSATEIG